MSDDDTKTDAADQAVEETTDSEATAEEVKEEVQEEAKEEKPEEKEEKKEDLSPEASAKGEKKEKPAPSGKFKDLIKQIEELSVLELSELVKVLEERFGVSAAPVAVASGAAAGGEAAPAVEEKSRYTVMLMESGSQKINVIKAVREINQQLGLKEAKDLVDGAPKEIAKDMPKEDAQKAKEKLEAAGAKAELR